MPVYRTTLFKLADTVQAQKVMSDAYKELAASSVKDGKPYIISFKSGPAAAEERSQGYAYVSQTVFKTKEDMDYYDSKDEAHTALKEKAKGFATERPLVVWFEADA